MIKLHRLRLQNFKQIDKLEITFPDKGSTLIEGHNEAGKSSLFEAVFYALYGKSLTDTNHFDLKRYKTEEMQVELEFSIHDRRFWVERTVRANHTVRMKCPTADDKVEEIKSTTACKERLLLELGISSTALLNTCFVEQKHLDKLESANTSERRQTVNELLNIKELSILENRFKVTPEDKLQVRTAEKRVRIAELDAAMPDLEQRVHAAYRSLLCREAQEREATRTDIEDQIVKTEYKRQANSARIAVIEEILAEGLILAEQLKAIRDVLPLQVQAWQTAETQQLAALAEVEALEKLAQELPARREELQRYEQYHTQLHALEQLQVEAIILARELKACQDALTAYDALQAEWDADEAERKKWEQTRTKRQQEHDTAQNAWDARQTSNRRAVQIQLLLQHTGAGTRFLAETEALAKQQNAIEAQKASLPGLGERQTQIKDAQLLVRRDTDLIQEQAHRAAKREALERQRGIAETLQTEIVESESRLKRLMTELDALRLEAERTQKQRAGVECGTALLEWADAKERSLEADPDADKQDDSTRKHAAAKAQLTASEDQIAAVKRKQIPAFALLGAGGVGIVAAFVTPFVIPLLALGILLGIGSGFLLTQTRKALIEATVIQNAAQETIREFDITQKVLAEQAVKFADQRARRLEEEATKRAALERLNLPTPESPTAARQQAEAYPSQSLEAARQAETNANTAVTQAEANRNALVQSLAREHERLTGFDLPALNASFLKIAEDEQQAVAEQEKITDKFQPLLHALNLANSEALTEAETELHKQITQVESAVSRLPELLRQETEKRDSAATEMQKAEQIAQALNLGGDTPQWWEQTAIAEQEAHNAQCYATPDAALQQRARAAADNLHAAEHELSQIAGRQADRKSRLDAENRAVLIANVQAATQKQSENHSEQQKYAPVLEQLQTLSLPLNAAELKTRLSLQKSSIEQDTESVAKLPDKRRIAANCDTNVTQNAAKFAESWRQTLPDISAPTLSEAPAQLEQHAQKISARHQGLALPERTTERDTLNNANIELGNANAASQQQADTLTTEITERYRKLGLDSATATEHIQRDPVLSSAHHRSAEEWNTEHEARKNSLVAAQTQRKTQAEDIYLPPQPLDLNAECAAHATARRELDIKTHATQIISTTRQSIVNRVMPLTIQNVRTLLPILTAGRYKDLQWNDADNSLQIYDERAGAHKSKNVFSGGAKDQISLALRLGFALATLPTGKTSRPNWLFLDEPLSSFDKERTLNLVHLLTKGILRKKFDQIFLISHSEAFDANLFDFHLKMENGMIAHSTL